MIYLIYVRVNEILKEKKKTKYWFIKNMECSHLMDNKTIAIHFETLEKICDVLQCEPGDVIVRKKTRKKVKKDEQTNEAV